MSLCHCCFEENGEDPVVLSCGHLICSACACRPTHPVFRLSSCPICNQPGAPTGRQKSAAAIQPDALSSGPRRWPTGATPHRPASAVSRRPCLTPPTRKQAGALETDSDASNSQPREDSLDSPSRRAYGRAYGRAASELAAEQDAKQAADHVAQLLPSYDMIRLAIMPGAPTAPLGFAIVGIYLTASLLPPTYHFPPTTYDLPLLSCPSQLTITYYLPPTTSHVPRPTYHPSTATYRNGSRGQDPPGLPTGGWRRRGDGALGLADTNPDPDP
eukprot:scaffold8620_cov62-Phaeocystis_antarctica.AAC.18